MTGKPKTGLALPELLGMWLGISLNLFLFSLFPYYVRGLNLLVGDLQSPCYCNTLFVQIQ